MAATAVAVRCRAQFSSPNVPVGAAAVGGAAAGGGALAAVGNARAAQASAPVEQQAVVEAKAEQPAAVAVEAKAEEKVAVEVKAEEKAVETTASVEKAPVIVKQQPRHVVRYYYQDDYQPRYTNYGHAAATATAAATLQPRLQPPLQLDHREGPARDDPARVGFGRYALWREDRPALCRTRFFEGAAKMRPQPISALLAASLVAARRGASREGRPARSRIVRRQT